MNKILIPTDFSDISENAVNYGIDMANYFSANIVLLHINQIPLTTPEFGLSGYNVNDIKDETMQSLQRMAAIIKDKYPLISSVDCYVEMGNATDAILEYSKLHDIDLVIMGNSGHGSNLRKNLMGSTSVSVSKKIEVPLIIVPPGAKYKKVQHIAYACDYDGRIEESTSLIKVRYLNTIFNSTLNILHVIPEEHLMNEEEAIIDNYVENKLATTEHRTYIITENNVSSGLLDFIENHDLDMIIIEPKKHSFFHSLFYPSVTNDLAFLSPIPVLVIHG